MDSVQWLDGKLKVLDQTRLPLEEVHLELSTYQEVAQAIKDMKVRGAPMIGVVAAYGIAIGALSIGAGTTSEFLDELDRIARVLASTRPTAVNLFGAIERMQRASRREQDITGIRAALVDEARAVHADEVKATELLSAFGAELVSDGFTIMTHCNAGALATSGDYGTALGVIRAARNQGKSIKVYATETRPLLQGARLTAWELMQDGIPVTLITDSMAGYVLSRGEISCVIVGADRVAANGDVANKVGTYSLAVLAGENRVPFYVAAPLTSIDVSLSSGTDIPIEHRSPREITHIQGLQIAPDGVTVVNPAFDVTPNRYISAIITEKGIIRPPYEANLRRLQADALQRDE